MLEQQRFGGDLARLLTPLALRDANRNSEALHVDTPTWYNTSGVTVAAATSSATSGCNVCNAEWGARRLSEKLSLDKDTLFQACSVSKPFQSMAILHYVSEGVIADLEDPVKSYLSYETYQGLLQVSIQKGTPEKLGTQLLDKMTVMQLLSHTAGTSTTGFEGYSPSSSYITSTTQILQGGVGNANSPAVHIAGIPGMQFQYSGGGSTILQAILENIGLDDGFTSFASLMRAKVLEPLGMDRSFYCDAAALPKSESNYATGYHNGSFSLEVGEYYIYPEQGAAGLWTTSVDLVKGISGFVNSLLGTASAVSLNGKPWIKPEVAEVILHRRAELGHGQKSYYCGFVIQFLDGEDDFPRDRDLVQISHSGSNNGYRCHVAATFTAPDRLQDGKEHLNTISAQAIMTNSNYGNEVISPLMHAISELLDRPLGIGLYAQGIPAVALDARPATPAAGWKAYAGVWGMKDRTQTLRIVATSEPFVEFSHLEGIQLPLWAVAERRDPKSMRLRVSSFEVALDFGWKQELGEVFLTVCTGGSRVKCARPSGQSSSGLHVK